MFRKAIELDPRNRRLTMFLADSLMRANRMKEAVAELTGLLQSGPAPPAAVVHLGQAYLALEQYEAAIRVLGAALQKVPEERQVHFGLAKAYERLNQPEKAQQHRDKVQQLAAVHREAGKGRVRAAGPPTAVHKDALRAHLDTAGVYFRHGNLSQAESLWRKAAALDPKDVECRQALAALYDRNGRSTEATRVREQLRDLAPPAAEARKKDQ
jgi:Flp pilus assembly protein TadD